MKLDKNYFTITFKILRKLYLTLYKSNRINVLLDAREPFDRNFIEQTPNFETLIEYSLYNKQKYFDASKHKLFQLFLNDYRVLSEGRKKTTTRLICLLWPGNL